LSKGQEAVSRKLKTNNMRQKENLSKEPLKAEPLDYRAQIKED
jgi:hypothetical protein